MTRPTMALTFLAGLALGVFLASWHLAGSIHRARREVEITHEQIEIAHQLNRQCFESLDAVWLKIDAARAEQTPRALAGKYKQMIEGD